ncbi:MAG TPA: hypothetical protein VK468_05075 [Pyrinomonadaceae bacterium]|nr:hypothetical protein [Pyrinomonadaceae bacterium]
MKDILMMILQLVATVCLLAVIFSLLNMAFGWHIGFKGAEVPADYRASLLFLAISVVFGGIVYFFGKENKPPTG